MFVGVLTPLSAVPPSAFSNLYFHAGMDVDPLDTSHLKALSEFVFRIVQCSVFRNQYPRASTRSDCTGRRV